MKKYTFRIYPKGRGREVYRVIEFPGEETLDELCECILEAFDFVHEHLYEFCMDNRVYSEDSYQCDSQGNEPGTDIAVEKIGLVKGQKFSLHYDFGDDWMFVIHVQKIEQTDEKVEPLLIKLKGSVEQYPSWDEWDEEE